MTNFISFPLRKTACLVPGFSFWKRQVALKGNSRSQTFVKPRTYKGKVYTPTKAMLLHHCSHVSVLFCVSAILVSVPPRLVLELDKMNG